MAEARACLVKSKTYLGEARNLKTEIKVEVTKGLEKLYRLVREAEAERKDSGGQGGKRFMELLGDEEKDKKTELETGEGREGLVKDRFLEKIEEHAKLLKENRDGMEKLSKIIKEHGMDLNKERVTYASAVAGPPRDQHLGGAAMHSVVITSKDEMESK